ncbi:hypothetical protein AJ80_04204 [Polytolypa hystricis UAMH7299]|uniref:BZIP domain-containing protein n=1 Tax=Polytolypa hystricis (strain UAMH7299) TaxID=1447883 RepID=A0A2B7YC64_POLH7|nr:hypothetical protein AJ80_04204 [Polytolypa hystricis UAMH7299]
MATTPENMMDTHPRPQRLYKRTGAQVDRKRVQDRESQRQSRIRKKALISSQQQKIRELESTNQQLRAGLDKAGSEGTALCCQLEEALERFKGLARHAELPTIPLESPFVAPSKRGILPDSGTVVSGNTRTSPFDIPSSLRSNDADHDIDTNPLRSFPPSLDIPPERLDQPFQAVSTADFAVPPLDYGDDVLYQVPSLPWTMRSNVIPPTCPLDSLLMTLVSTAREQLRSGHTSLASTAPSDPSLSVLLNTNNDRQVDTISHVISKVVLKFSCLLPALPERVACIWIFHRIVQWKVCQTQATYERIPPWARPMISQIVTPHPEWMDYVPWPRMRAALTNNHKRYDQNELFLPYTEVISINWPYDAEDCISHAGDSEVSMNPIFEKHCQRIENWSLGPGFAKAYPCLGGTYNVVSDIDTAHNVGLSNFAMPALPRDAKLDRVLNGHPSDSQVRNSHAVTMSEIHSRQSQPIHIERPMRIICIGAGASGLLFAYKLQRSFENFELIVYEKNPEIAGTWYENRYPGCACDTPSHNYTYSFEPWAEWPSVYAGAKDIFKYFDNFSRKYDLRKYCRVDHEVVGTAWDTNHNRWDVKVRDVNADRVFEDSCDILINAGGILNGWKWPAIPGLKNFRGTLLHSANYDESTDLRGKRVGLIGNGSSGIQILPTIQPLVSKVTTFIRGPTWVSPIQGLEPHDYSEEERRTFSENPEVLLEHRRKYERGLNTQFGIFLQDTLKQKATRGYMTQAMREKLKNPQLEEQLIPRFAVGCRRLTPGIGYLESLGKENVEVAYGEILQVTENGCLCDDEREHAVDVLICATGFDTSFQPRFPIVNHRGVNLQDYWSQQEPAGYLGLAVAGFPNYLCFLGPNCPIGNGPLLSAIEVQADYMLNLVNRWQTENWAMFSPKEEAVRDFIAYKDEYMKKTIWVEPCRSWYKNNTAEGKVTALWPGSSLHYIEAMKDVRYEDWDIKYDGNRFAWLGNGYSQTELDKLADTGYYIRTEDDSPYLSRSKARKVETKHGTMVDQDGANFFDALTGKAATKERVSHNEP